MTKWHSKKNWQSWIKTFFPVFLEQTCVYDGFLLKWNITDRIVKFPLTWIFYESGGIRVLDLNKWASFFIVSRNRKSFFPPDAFVVVISRHAFPNIRDPPLEFGSRKMIPRWCRFHLNFVEGSLITTNETIAKDFWPFSCSLSVQGPFLLKTWCEGQA